MKNVVLLNVGGPQGQADVYPFLKSFFADPAIFPWPWAAPLLARLRLNHAKKIYQQMGGGSPLLAQTQAQADALQAVLGDGYAVKVAMRHAPPLIQDVARATKDALLVPLCPQYSTTTTGSFLSVWGPSPHVASYPALEGFIAAMADLMAPCLARAHAHGEPRILLTAHGLPLSIVRKGDPYPQHVEETASALQQRLGINATVCYQSRLGFMQWLGPYLRDTIKENAQHPLVIVPISFVSEHAETLVELDGDMKELALENGCPHYERVPTVGTHPLFIEGLAGLVREHDARGL